MKMDCATDLKPQSQSLASRYAGKTVVAIGAHPDDLEIGIGAGTSAWLDLKTGFGQVRNALDETATPRESTGETVEVRAHTGFGDITIHRA